MEENAPSGGEVRSRSDFLGLASRNRSYVSVLLVYSARRLLVMEAHDWWCLSLSLADDLCCSELATEEGGEVGKVGGRGRVKDGGECSEGPQGLKGALRMRVGTLSG